MSSTDRAAGIGRKFQTPSIYENLTVFENLEVSFRAARACSALLFRRTDEVRERVQEVAGEIFLAESLDTRRACSRTARSSGSRSACC
jgi:urea transport system ATP-binding protein